MEWVGYREVGEDDCDDKVKEDTTKRSVKEEKCGGNGFNRSKVKVVERTVVRSGCGEVGWTAVGDFVMGMILVRRS